MPNDHARAMKAIRGLDYTVIFCRDLPAMTAFYQDVMGFERAPNLSDTWIEFRVGSTTLALTRPGGRFPSPAPEGPTLQLAFRVPPPAVAACAAALRAQGVEPLEDVADQPFGHRTLFFRDPDGNLLEISAEL